MSQVLTISGETSYSPQAAAIINHAQRLLRRYCLHADVLAARSLPSEDLLHARKDSPAIQQATLNLEAAQGVIVATPVCRASYTGLLKAFLDVLPPDIFRGKTVLPLAIGGSASQFPALDYALHQVLAALGAKPILNGVYMTEAQIQFEHGGTLHLEETVAQHLQGSLEAFAARVRCSSPFDSETEYAARRLSFHVGAGEATEADYLLEAFER